MSLGMIDDRERNRLISYVDGLIASVALTDSTELSSTFRTKDDGSSSTAIGRTKRLADAVQAYTTILVVLLRNYRSHPFSPNCEAETS